LALVRDASQHSIGVDRVGVSNDLKHRHVGLGVGVGGRFGEVDSSFARELLDGEGLVGSLGEELHLAGELSLLVDRGSRGDGARNSQ
jgi:hypothetical protein